MASLVGAGVSAWAGEVWGRSVCVCVLSVQTNTSVETKFWLWNCSENEMSPAIFGNDCFLSGRDIMEL